MHSTHTHTAALLSLPFARTHAHATVRIQSATLSLSVSYTSPCACWYCRRDARSICACTSRLRMRWPDVGASRRSLGVPAPDLKLSRAPCAVAGSAARAAPRGLDASRYLLSSVRSAERPPSAAYPVRAYASASRPAVRAPMATLGVTSVPPATTASARVNASGESAARRRSVTGSSENPPGRNPAWCTVGTGTDTDALY